MKTYLLIGLNQKRDERDLSVGEFIEYLYFENDEKAYNNLADELWKNRFFRDYLRKYDLLFLIDETLHIIARASLSTDIVYLCTHLDFSEDFTNYHPVYVDLAEHDERILLEEALEVDDLDIGDYGEDE
jgi:hypothetical protein